jgi:hypothetical protein
MRGYGSYLKEARTKSESKPTCGKYAAQRIVCEKKKIPDEFVQVIDEITKNNLVR